MTRPVVTMVVLGGLATSANRCGTPDDDEIAHMPPPRSERRGWVTSGRSPARECSGRGDGAQQQHQSDLKQIARSARTPVWFCNCSAVRGGVLIVERVLPSLLAAVVVAAAVPASVQPPSLLPLALAAGCLDADACRDAEAEAGACIVCCACRGEGGRGFASSPISASTPHPSLQLLPSGPACPCGHVAPRATRTFIWQNSLVN